MDEPSRSSDGNARLGPGIGFASVRIVNWDGVFAGQRDSKMRP